VSVEALCSQFRNSKVRRARVRPEAPETPEDDRDGDAELIAQVRLWRFVRIFVAQLARGCRE
jgi:hypothetical protein